MLKLDYFEYMYGEFGCGEFWCGEFNNSAYFYFRISQFVLHLSNIFVSKLCFVVNKFARAFVRV